MDNTSGKPERVDNLADFIKITSKFPSSKYEKFVFRGENGIFDERLSSAFVPTRQTSKNSGYYLDFMEPINDFYSEVGHNIADEAKREFLAFSQHYGLRTNLLDITQNPLVALFFACFRHEGNEEYEGSVYIFSDKNFLDITELIKKSPLENIIDMLAIGDYEILKKMSALIKKYFKWHSNQVMFTGIHSDSTPVYRKEGICEHCGIAVGVKYVENMMFRVFCHARDKYIENGGSALNVSSISYNDLVKTYEDKQVTMGEFIGRGTSGHEHFESLFQRLCEQNEPIKNMASQARDNATYYVSFLHYSLKCDQATDVDDHGDLEPYTNFLPPMIYNPSTLFERARLQRGYFIYQPYMRIEVIPDSILLPFPNSLNGQGVKVDIVNTFAVRNDLDNVNINQGTLFGDPDNMAQYLKKKYGG